jgi:hypothetical protein
MSSEVVACALCLDNITEGSCFVFKSTRFDYVTVFVHEECARHLAEMLA